MKRILDEIAEAIDATKRPWRPRVLVANTDLCHQFSSPITPCLWNGIGARLSCILPPLKKRTDGRWIFPNRCKTVWELARVVASQHPDWEIPLYSQYELWREAQVFVGVRACLVAALNVEEEEVVRSATLQGDLGAE
jgi:hypothetical protein